MTKTEIQDALRDCQLMSDFSDTELDAFIDLFDPVEVKDGECVVRQDEVGDCMYLLVRGHAAVNHHRGDRTITLAQLKCGDFFGEIALVDHGARSADVQAEGDCVLLAITQAALSALAGVYPTAAFKFLITLGRILVNRLRLANERYIDSLLIPLQRAESAG